MDGQYYEEVIHLIADTMDALDREAPGREHSLVQTKLDEAMMWADRGLKAARKSINEAASE